MYKIRSFVLQNTLAAIDVILPPRCVVSGDLVDRQGMISPSGWRKLDFISAPFCKCCGYPFDYDVGDESLCASCLQDTPVFTSARAALRYEEGSRDLILGFKHGDKTHAVRSFVPWLMRAGQTMLEEADYLVPVPLHRSRLLRRRYNQAALMAFALSRECGTPCLPMGLGRVRATTSQGHLHADERAKNVRKAFSVPNNVRARLQEKKIILIDDVFTTGATVSECTKALLGAGAHEVHVLTLARVANFTK